ncbi:MAG: spore maturation protein, partial [Sphingobacteriales bacterium]
MALSRIWSAFIIVAILAAAVKWIFVPGFNDIFYWMVVGKADDITNLTKVDGIIETCKAAVNICINLIGITALFMGFLSIAEKAGGIQFLS